MMEISSLAADEMKAVYTSGLRPTLCTLCVLWPNGSCALCYNKMQVHVGGNLIEHDMLRGLAIEKSAPAQALGSTQPKHWLPIVN